MKLRHLIRAKRWAARRPSDARVKLVLGAVAVCLILLAVERFIGWPDALTTELARPPKANP